MKRLGLCALVIVSLAACREKPQPIAETPPKMVPGAVLPAIEPDDALSEQAPPAASKPVDANVVARARTASADLEKLIAAGSAEIAGGTPDADAWKEWLPGWTARLNGVAAGIPAAPPEGGDLNLALGHQKLVQAVEELRGINRANVAMRFNAASLAAQEARGFLDQAGDADSGL